MQLRAASDRVLASLRRRRTFFCPHGCWRQVQYDVGRGLRFYWECVDCQHQLRSLTEPPAGRLCSERGRLLSLPLSPQRVPTEAKVEEDLEAEAAEAALAAVPSHSPPGFDYAAADDNGSDSEHAGPAAEPSQSPASAGFDYYAADGYGSGSEHSAPAAGGGGGVPLAEDAQPPGGGGEDSQAMSEDEQAELADALAFEDQVVPVAAVWFEVFAPGEDSDGPDDPEPPAPPVHAAPVDPSVGSTSGASAKESEDSSPPADFDVEPDDPNWAGAASPRWEEDSDEQRDRSGLDRSLSWS